MYTVNEITIEGDMLVANVTLIVGKGEELVVTVPVRFPKDKETVLAAIEQREKNENVKYDAAPILTALKVDLDATIVGKAQTAKVG
jgi:hypothetical protein